MVETLVFLERKGATRTFSPNRFSLIIALTSGDTFDAVNLPVDFSSPSSIEKRSPKLLMAAIYATAFEPRQSATEYFHVCLFASGTPSRTRYVPPVLRGKMEISRFPEESRRSFFLCARARACVCVREKEGKFSPRRHYDISSKTLFLTRSCTTIGCTGKVANFHWYKVDAIPPRGAV